MVCSLLIRLMSKGADEMADLPIDVVRLVIAARKVAFGDGDDSDLRELDIASEAFADLVPWDNEPCGPFTLSRTRLGFLIGDERIMASTAIQPAGWWRLRDDDLWEFIPDDSDI